ncbi:MAG: glycerol kinase GlpK [Bacteroidales bacterium]|jgi:glycerol kinase|nr:glycerol kinase GlpK [Bacteroidales bacterium]
MKKKYILSLDQGTTSSRAVLFDKQAKIAGISQIETKQIFPFPGWVEQNAEEIWQNQWQAARDVMNSLNVASSDIAAIGITNQRETTVVWNKKTGKPVCNAIIWQDKRTSEVCKKLREEGWTDYIQENTGLVIDSYFSATKLHWILNNISGVKEKAKNGDLLFGTIDTYLAWKLSGEKLHITDYSNASRTMLFNIKSLCWDKKLCELFGIPECMLPEVVDSSKLYGHTDATVFDGISIPLSGIAGDQQAALFGQNCLEKGMIKNTYGTGCFLLMNSGEKPVRSKQGLLSTIAWGIDGKISYALEGSVFIAGAVIKWMRDNLGIISAAAETEKIALEAENNHGVYFVPAFAGLGAPYWDMDARGIITGLTLSSEKKHIIRAGLEAMAFQTKDVVNAMQIDSGIEDLKIMNVDGGAAANNFLLQFQADILDVTVVRPVSIESTALGAAFLAGVAIDYWDKNQLSLLKETDRIFKPEIDKFKREFLYNEWKKAVNKSRL